MPAALQSREMKYRYNWSAPIIVSEHDTRTIYHASNYVVRSRDRGMRINVDVTDADLADVIDQIARQTGQNILVDPSVHETVTVALYDVHWREAVDVIARMTRCEIQVLRGNRFIPQ